MVIFHSFLYVYQRVSTQEISGTPPKKKRWIWKISGLQPDPAFFGDPTTLEKWQENPPNFHGYYPLVN